MDSKSAHSGVAGCQFTSSARVHVHVWHCVILERMLVGKSSTVLIFKVGFSLLCTTVTFRKTNKNVRA